MCRRVETDIEFVNTHQNACRILHRQLDKQLGKIDKKIYCEQLEKERGLWLNETIANVKERAKHGDSWVEETDKNEKCYNDCGDKHRDYELFRLQGTIVRACRDCLNNHLHDSDEWITQVYTIFGTTKPRLVKEINT